MMNQINVKNCPNLRDIGGKTGIGGKTVRAGRLIRSSKTDKLTPEDIRVLKEQTGVSAIIDLRTENEVEKAPDITFGCAYYNVPLRPDVRAGVKYRFPSSLKAYAQKFPSMPQMYVDMLTSTYSVGQLKKIFAILFDAVQKDECVLFHCTEGKDRTGIVAALIDLLLGVDRDRIMEDYLYSNEAFKKRNRRYYLLTLIAFRDAAYAKEFKMMYEAHPSMLRSVFEIVDDRGGIDAYFTERLGLSQTDVDAFRHKMLY